jgi:hypothetical protein
VGWYFKQLINRVEFLFRLGFIRLLDARKEGGQAVGELLLSAFFDEERVRARRHDALDDLKLITSRTDDDFEVRSIGPGGEPSADLQPIDARHQEIDEDQAEGTLFEDLQGGLAALGRLDLEPRAFMALESTMSTAGLSSTMRTFLLVIGDMRCSWIFQRGLDGSIGAVDGPWIDPHSKGRKTPALNVKIPSKTE